MRDPASSHRHVIERLVVATHNPYKLAEIEAVLIDSWS